MLFFDSWDPQIDSFKFSLATTLGFLYSFNFLDLIFDFVACSIFLCLFVPLYYSHRLLPDFHCPNPNSISRFCSLFMTSVADFTSGKEKVMTASEGFSSKDFPPLPKKPSNVSNSPEPSATALIPSLSWRALFSSNAKLQYFESKVEDGKRVFCISKRSS